MDIGLYCGTVPRRTRSLHTLWPILLTRGKVVELTEGSLSPRPSAKLISTPQVLRIVCGVLKYFVHAALLLL
jgi:hypothetical protein